MAVRDTNSFNVRIHPNPTAEIIFSNTCDENPVNFQINTNNGDGIITEWQFDYINGLNNSGNLSQNIPSSLQFTYPQCGDYAISLFIRDSLISPFGQGTLLIGTDDNNNYCESTIDTTITIYCPPIANIVSVDPYVCEGDTSFLPIFHNKVLLLHTPIDTSLYSWVFGSNGIGDSTTINGYWIYDTCNIYDNIYLITTDTNGCKDTSNLVNTEVLCNTEASFTIDNATFVVLIL